MHAISPCQLLPCPQRDKDGFRSDIDTVRRPGEQGGRIIKILGSVGAGIGGVLRLVALCGRFAEQPPRASRPAKEASRAGLLLVAARR